MGVTNPYVLKNVVSFVLLTNPWSFQIAKDLFIDFFSLPEWNVSSYFKLNSCRILTGKSPWKKCGLFHHAHVINKINIRAYNLHHHYLTIPLWESLYIFTNIFDALYLDCIYIPYTIVEIDMHYFCCSVANSFWLFVSLRTAARQASLSITISWSLLTLVSIESVMPSNQLILCRPLLLLASS